MRWADGPHEHAVHFYADDDELVDGVVAHLAARPPAASVVIARPAVREALAARRRDVGLADPVVDLDAGATLDRFMVGDRPDRERFRAVVGEAVAVVAGGTDDGEVQAFGEMVALLWADGNREGALVLEDLWNELGREHALTLRCAYPMAAIAGADDLTATAHVCSTHSRVEGPHGDHTPVPDPAADRRSSIFVPVLASIRGVRSFVADTLAAWDDDALADDALLVASELATNAVRHAESPLRLVVSRTPESITIAVDDVSSTLPTARVATLDGYGGRGMPIVAALSSCHGAEVTDEGKTVWSTLARSA